MPHSLQHVAWHCAWLYDWCHVFDTYYWHNTKGNQMAVIHIERAHQLGLKKARKIAFAWAEQIENEFDMTCTYEEGKTDDLLTFSRSGVKGTLAITAKQLVLQAQLGLVMSAFKETIEAQITQNLDQLLQG
jgi:putative polyhydroxyalkanoate system protein